MPFCNDAFMKRMVILGCRLRNELPMARTYSFHAFPLELQMGERLMSPRTVMLNAFRRFLCFSRVRSKDAVCAVSEAFSLYSSLVFLFISRKRTMFSIYFRLKRTLCHSFLHEMHICTSPWHKRILEV